MLLGLLIRRRKSSAASFSGARKASYSGVSGILGEEALKFGSG